MDRLKTAARWASASTLASTLLLAACAGITLATFLILQTSDAYTTGIVIGAETFQINNGEASRAPTFAYAAFGVCGAIAIMSIIQLARMSNSEWKPTRYLSLANWVLLLVGAGLASASLFYLYDATIYSDSTLGVFHNLATPTANTLFNVNWASLLLGVLGAGALAGVLNIYHFVITREKSS
jgi:glucan phosphoethanolaminetransferase (alkaline phosphatase superfamily)